MSSIGTIWLITPFAVPSGHLVARLQLALHRDEYLDHLHDAGRQLVAALSCRSCRRSAVRAASWPRHIGGVSLRYRPSRLRPSARFPTIGCAGVGQRLGNHRGAFAHPLGPRATSCPSEYRADGHRRCGRGSAIRHRGPGGRSISSRSIAMARSSFSTPCRLNTRTPPPSLNAGRQFQRCVAHIRRFSPKIARRSFSSGVIGLSPLGVILPTRMSPGFTSAPI